MPSHDPADSNPAPDLSRRGFLAAGSGAALAGALGWSVLSPTVASASDQNPDTDFMSGHYGMFIKIEDSRLNTGVDQGGTVGGWNAVANSFDVTTFATQMADTGASWVAVYVGQNTGFYFGGNPDYETLAGVAPGSRLTSRDLMTDIANALSAKGIKMFIYIPAGPAIDDTVVANNLGFTTRSGGDFGHDWYHTATGDTNWASALRGWATHYGTKVSGWWIDGFFGPVTSHYLGVTTTTAQKYATAIHAGNPHAVIGYNEWRFDNPTAAPYYDFTAGYVPPASVPAPTSRWTDSNGTRVQWNLTMGQQFIGGSDFISYSMSVLAAGGSLMFEAFTDTSGRINNSTVYSQMTALKAAVNGTGTPITPYMWTAASGWQRTAAITVPSAGTAVHLGPWPTSGGSWSWSGPNGYSANTREVQNIPLRAGSNVFNATHTNPSGAQSTLAFTVTVPGGTPITATASSVENSSLPASNAVDGNSSTRWSSQFSDPQWLQIDLGTPQTFTKVVLSWETAYGKDYQIQTSNDGTNWTTVYTRTGGSGGTETLTGFTGTGRYVRMYGTARGTGWGYSLYEFQVMS